MMHRLNATSFVQWEEDVEMKLTLQRLHMAFLAFAALFVVLMPFYPRYPGAVVLKTLPALSLAALVLLHVSGTQGKLLFLALLFSAAGDAALGLNDVYGGMYFVIGLGLFLVAQLLYVGAFAMGFELNRSRTAIAAIVVAYSLILAWLLRPGLGEMALPVFAYIVVITTMAVLAVLRADGTHLAIGALVFMLSDSLIAINRFLTPVPAARFLIIVTYFFAQYMITRAFVGRLETGG
jgi:uncharacterized membrane protein YhhN